MVNRRIDLNKSVFELSKDYPELPEILAELGFKDIIKPGMLNTAGRFMTINKGATLKKISLDTIRETLASNGYDVVG